jgi:hypothetical protein
MLQEEHEKLMKPRKYVTEPSTIYRIFELYEESEKNESGETPVFIKKEEPEKKKKL